MTIYLGLDPGLHGGYAMVTTTCHPTLTQHVGIMPVTGGVIDCRALSAGLADLHRQAGLHVVIEQVGAMPKQGLGSTFKFGMGYGQLIGMCQALALPYSLVRPQAWKAKVLAGTQKDKDAAIAFCTREYPAVRLIPERCRVPHDGIADALCLAHYGAHFLAAKTLAT